MWLLYTVTITTISACVLSCPGDRAPQLLSYPDSLSFRSLSFRSFPVPATCLGWPPALPVLMAPPPSRLDFLSLTPVLFQLPVRSVTSASPVLIACPWPLSCSSCLFVVAAQPLSCPDCPSLALYCSSCLFVVAAQPLACPDCPSVALSCSSYLSAVLLVPPLS